MKTSQIIAAAALSLLAAAGAHAETYDGVHALTHERNRAEVSAEAVVAARSGNPYGESVTSVARPTGPALARSDVRAEAYVTAHAPNQNLDRKAFVNSVIPSQYANASLSNRTVQAGE